MKPSLLKPLGWIALCLAALLAAGTLWAYGAIQQSIGSLPISVAQTTALAAKAVDDLAEMIKTRADIADDTVQTLSNARAVLAKVKVAAERQLAHLPHHETTIRAVAANTGGLSRAAEKVANALFVQVPLLNMQPFQAQAQAMRSFAGALAATTVSLNETADSIKADAVPFATSMIDFSVSGMSLTEHARQAAEALKSQQLPQLASTLKQAALTLKRTSDQASVLAYLPLCLLVLGILIAALLAVMGTALLTIATAIGPILAASATTINQKDNQ